MQNKRPERLQIMLDGDELGAIDDFRFKHRMPSRASAVREILRRGLIAAGDRPPESVRSADFGVLDSKRAPKRLRKSQT
jgi:hypothetical protein